MSRLDRGVLLGPYARPVEVKAFAFNLDSPGRVGRDAARKRIGRAANNACTISSVRGANHRVARTESVRVVDHCGIEPRVGADAVYPLQRSATSQEVRRRPERPK